MIRSALFAALLSLSACAATAPTIQPVQPTQTNASRDALARQGIRAIDEGRFDEAIQIFDGLLAQDPTSIDYAYEKAYAYYGKKDYDGAVALLEPLREGESSPHVFRLLGNAYDMRGQADRALATYQEGERRFPKIGFLHFDHGVCLLGRDDLAGAVVQFATAVDLDPRHVGSHYMLARLVGGVLPAMALVHAEVVMALEPGGERALEMSRLVRGLYVQLVDDARAGKPPAEADNPYAILFHTTLAAVVKSGAIAGHELEDIATLRGTMLFTWVNAEETFAVPSLVGWQHRIAEAGHLEAYNHWVLGVGDDSFRPWCEAGHADACNAFVEWFKANDFDPGAVGPG